MMAECEIPVQLAVRNLALEAPEAELTIVEDPTNGTNGGDEVGTAVEAPLSKNEVELTRTVDVPLPAPTDPDPSTSAPAGAPAATESPPRRQTLRRSYTTEFKLECVEYAEKTNNKTETARVFNINRRRVQEWCMQKEKLKSIPKEQKRLSGGGRLKGGHNPPPNPTGLDAPKPATSEDLLCTPTIQATSKILDNTSLKPETGKQDVPQVPPIQVPQAVSSIHVPDTIIQEAITDGLLRGLSSTDLTTLSPNILKVIHDLSMEVMLNDPRNAAIREELLSASAKSREALLESTPTLLNQQATVGAGSGSKDLTSSALDAASTQQDTQVAHSDVSRAEAASGSGLLNPASLQQSMEDVLAPAAGAVAEVSNALQSAILGGQLQMDASVQATLLDTLLQQLSSLQTPPVDVLHQTAVPVTSNSVTDEAQAKPLSKAEENLSAAADVEPTPDITDSQDQADLSEQVTPMEVDSSVEAAPSSTPQPAKAKEEDEETPLPAAKTRKVKKVYSLDFKLECVAFAESKSKCAAAREFKVDRRRVQDWCSQKTKLQQLRSLRMGEQNKIDDKDIEKELVEWVKQQQATGKSLTRRMVGEEAVRLFNERGNVEFTASIGWVAKFMIRYGISLVSPRPSPHLQPVTPPTPSFLQSKPLTGTDAMSCSS